MTKMCISVIEEKHSEWQMLTIVYLAVTSEPKQTVV